MRFICLLSVIFVTLNCLGQNGKNKIDFSGLYANEYGEILLKQVNETKVKVSFQNNKRDVFDTIMLTDYDFKMVKNNNSLPFLSFNSRAGVELYPECLFVHEFTAGIYLAQFIWIEKIFLRPFYKIGVPLTFNGNIKLSKGGATVDGIYLKNYKSQQGYFKITGTILKEKYPIAYYSTKESPQGMFADTSIIHYRLIMNEYKVNNPDRQRFKGKLTNNLGKAAFIWEYADSEVYYFEGKELWKVNMMGKEVTVEAVLVQSRKKASVLKDWKIL